MREALFVKRMDHGVTGTVFKVRRTRMGRSAHFPLMERSVRLTVVRISHVIHLENILSGTLRKIFDRILIAEIIGTFDRVKYVRLDTVRGIRDTCDTVHAALCHRRSRTRRHQFRHHGNFKILIFHCRKSCAHSCSAASDNENVIRDVAGFDFFRYIFAVPAHAATDRQNNAGCRHSFDKASTGKLSGHMIPSCFIHT